MAYQTGTATSTEDFVNTLQTFAVAQGWMLDIFSAGNSWMAMNNGSVYIQVRWDTNGRLGIFQSLGFVNTSTAPGNHTNDAGLCNVDASTPYNSTISSSTNSRFLDLPNGPITSYHFFTDDTTKYIYAVIQVSPGVYYHMGMGTIDKLGTWTGGEFVYGDEGTDTSPPVNVSGTAFTSYSSTTSSSVTQFSMHIEGLPGQNGSGKWMLGLATNNTVGDNPAGNDRSGNPRMTGWVAHISSGFNVALSRFRYGLTNGLLPLMPMEVWYKYTISLNQNRCYLIGYMPDVYVINMALFNAEDEVTIGSDTYIIFPARQKGVSHGNMGYVYRKVV